MIHLLWKSSVMSNQTTVNPKMLHTVSSRGWERRKAYKTTYGSKRLSLFKKNWSQYTAEQGMNLHIPINTSYQQTISSLIQADLSDMFKTDSMTTVVSPDSYQINFFSYNYAWSTVSWPYTSLVKTKETPENTKGEPDAPLPAAEWDIQMVYSSN